MSKISVIFLFLFSVLAAVNAGAEDSFSADEKRKIDLEWAPVPKAAGYEIQMANDSEFTGEVSNQILQETRLELDLLPGAYYYRIRAIDSDGFPGLWTPTQELTINPRPPSPIEPADHAIIDGDLMDTGLMLKWKSSGLGIRYLLEIVAEDAEGNFSKTVLKQEVSETEFAFYPKEPGTYQWTVHTLGVGGAEAGVSWIFTVKGSVPRKAKPPAKPVIRYVSPWWRGHWTLFLRYGQANLSYSLRDMDIMANSGFNGLVGYAGQSLHWEWHDPLPRVRLIPWLQFDYELVRQAVLSESAVMPKVTARVGGWYDELLDNFRFGPSLEYGSRELTIYQPRSPTDAVRSLSRRNHFGIGLAAEYQLKEYITLGAEARYRFESGGSAGVALRPGTGDQYVIDRRAGDLLPSQTIEAALLGTMKMGPMLLVQGRFRFEQSTETWVPLYLQNGQPPTVNTEFTLQYIGFDVSVGIHF